ncbi:MAG: SpoIID/LytB domain-containing protein, partial [Chloroflexi bacterium]|nr:SpoIID/LytB domain-containing protein [Chloroflexota bacterium]
MSNLSRRTALFSRLPVLCLAMALLAGLLSVQGKPAARAETGGFTGEVRDVLTRLPIAGAVVSAGQIVASTGADGQYTLEVPPGTYEVFVRAVGYVGMSLSQQTAQAEGSSRADFAMIPASPNAEQRAQLDALFAQESAVAITSEELEALRATDLDSASTPRLPATVRVLMPDGIVVVMPLVEYVRGVLPREMPPHWPLEALKAQAVIARCYTANARRHTEVGADLCTTVHCQVWGPVHYETTDRAVYETHNVAVTHSGRIISTFYFAHCDGRTRNSENVWQTALPYCRSVACPCGYTSMYGHGVGLCQQGARVLAETGRAYTDILMHYYTGVQVVALPPHTLTQGRVTPAEGDTATLFTYEVVYTGPDPAIAAYLYIDDYSYSMAPVGSSGSGLLYRYTTQLPVGSHTYAFRFEDGYSPAATFPQSGTLAGPSVRLRDSTLPTPTPLPTPSGTRGWQWTQTTRTDWADGTGSNVVLTTEGDGEVSLAPDQVQGVYTSTIKEAPLEFVALGSSWQARTPPGTSLVVELRAGTADGAWSAWQSVPPMDAERETSPLFHGELLYLAGTRLQYRVTFLSRQAGVIPILYSLTLTAIDSRQGPTADESLAGTTTPADGGPAIISRAAWGTNPAWM